MEFGLSADFPRCACAALPLDVLGGLLTDFELGFPSCSCSRSTAVTFPRVFVLTCGGKKPTVLFVFESLPKYRCHVACSGVWFLRDSALLKLKVAETEAETFYLESN